MDYIDLQGKKVSNITNQDKLLSFLYTNIFGRMLLKPLIQPQVSKLAGRYLSSAHSKWLISKFIERNEINMDIYEECDYSSFNDFFHATVWQRFIQFRRTQHFPLKIQNTPCVLCFAVHA